MKKFIFAMIIATFSAPALADGISTVVGAERKMEAETNHIYTDFSATSGSMGATVGFNWADTAADNANFNFTSAEIDTSYTISDNLTLYVNNDWDNDFKHTETVIGGKFKF
jgi:hypothetical protein